MRIGIALHLLGLILALFSLTLIPPMIVGWWTGDGAATAFLYALAPILAVGLLMWLPFRGHTRELRLRDGFVLVTLLWLGLGLAGALPFMIAEHPHMQFADAVFESLSALTATGATVLSGLDTLPRSILYYRAQLNWLGGMGIVVLAVAILPLLRIGGMQLYRAETPGPMKDSKLTPRIAETAKALWLIYVALTAACMLALWAGGMTLFDAVAFSFSLLSLGGLSTHDASFGYYRSPLLESIAVLFMVLAALNFGLHFLAWRNRSLLHYVRDAEFRAFVWIYAGGCIFVTAALLATSTYTDLRLAAREAVFQVVSFGTTAGLTTADLAAWPVFLPTFLVFLSFVGGCAGSTGGGMKVVRVLLLYKQGMRELRRLVHPNAVIPIRLGNAPIPYRVIEAVWGFFAAYIAAFVVLLIGAMMTGLDQVTAFSAVAACLNNMGTGLGAVSANFSGLNDVAKLLLALAMVIGRLEIFTFALLLTPHFWRA